MKGSLQTELPTLSLFASAKAHCCLTSDWCPEHLKFTWTDLLKMRSPVVYQKLSFVVCVNVSQLIFVFQNGWHGNFEEAFQMFTDT